MRCFIWNVVIGVVVTISIVIDVAAAAIVIAIVSYLLLKVAIAESIECRTKCLALPFLSQIRQGSSMFLVY